MIIKAIYNSVDLSSHPFYLEEVEGIDGLQGNYTTTKGIGQAGSTVTSQQYEERGIHLSGVIYAETPEEMEKQRQRLLTLFDPAKEGKLECQAGGIARCIWVRVEQAPRFSGAGTKRVMRFDVGLVAFHPFWEDAKERKIEMAVWKGAFSFPLAIEPPGLLIGFKQPQLICNIQNTGDSAVGMTIRFFARGSLKNPSLFDVKKRKQIKIYKAMQQGEEIRVTTRYGEKAATRKYNGTTENAMPYLHVYEPDFEFLQLELGENLLRHDAETGADNLEITIYYKNQYLGV